MNQTEAFELTQKLMLGLQYARSVSKEELTKFVVNKELNEDLIDSVLEDLTPWLHGRKGNAFLSAVERVVESGKVNGMDFYNFMTIIHTLEPTIGAMVSILSGV